MHIYARPTVVVNKTSGLFWGKAKVAPASGHTNPRLELSAAVLAVEITQTMVDNLDLHINTVKFYTDSK